ncbi:MAG: CHC2 zinc finger domain-containing protein [Conexivisphaerales archaeon]
MVKKIKKGCVSPRGETQPNHKTQKTKFLKSSIPKKAIFSNPARFLKEGISPKEVYERYVGGPLQKAGKGWLGLCPFHNDHHPSFSIRERSFHCFGCGWQGDIVSFVRDLKGLDFKSTVKLLSKDFGLEDEGCDFLFLCEKLGLSPDNSIFQEFLNLGIWEGEYIGKRALFWAYELPNGETYMVRVRKAKEGDRFRWWKGKDEEGREGYWDGWGNLLGVGEKRSPIPLGLFHLEEYEPIRGVPYLFIVEGETDWTALLLLGVPAICLPGKSSIPPSEAAKWLRPYKGKFSKVVIVVEEDSVKEMEQIGLALAKEGFEVDCLEIYLLGYKDVAEWYKAKAREKRPSKEDWLSFVYPKRRCDNYGNIF